MKNTRFLFSIALSIAFLHSVSPSHGQELVLSGAKGGELQPIATGTMDGHHGTVVGDSCNGRCGGGLRGRARQAIQNGRQAMVEGQHHANLLSITGGTAIYTDQWNQHHAQMQPWHGAYYHRDWGQPLAVVVPPTAQNQTNWGWGVGNTTSTPIYHQFARPYPGTYPDGEGYPGGQFQPTPYWPSHTSQFGAYYIRAPW